MNLKKIHQDVQFEVQVLQYDNVIDALVEHNKDIGIVMSPFDSAYMTKIPLAKSEFVCAYAKGEFSDTIERLHLSQLNELPYISIEDSGPLSHILSSYTGDESIGIDVSLVAQTYFVARNLVAFGGGISVVDEYTARSEGAGPIKFKGFQPALYFDLCAIHIENRRPAKICLDFLDFFKQNFLENHTPL
ncbi:LysR substrate-binding domain-containing protein [Aliikangiella maris]|uniref:LysR substrate-binding domain-containing protein n=2 Tax=Aliikangiella maris TaxID=3162458 RepID=A0ABV3MSP2_9GAMM